LEAFPGTGKTTAILDEIGSRTGFSRGIDKLIIVSRTGRANSISERFSERSDDAPQKIGKLLARDPAKRGKRDSFIETIQNVENKPILIAQIAGNSRVNKAIEEELLTLKNVDQVVIFDSDRLFSRKNEQFLRRLFRSLPNNTQKIIVSDGLSKTPESALTFFLGGKFKEIQSNSEPSFHPSDIQICNLSSFSKDVSAPGLEKRLVLCYTKKTLQELKENLQRNQNGIKCMTVNDFLTQQTSRVEKECFLVEMPRFDDCIDIWSISNQVSKLKIYIDENDDMDLRLKAALYHLQNK